MLLLIDVCSRQERIHPHLASRWNGLLDHGRDWIHCEAEYVHTQAPREWRRREDKG